MFPNHLSKCVFKEKVVTTGDGLVVNSVEPLPILPPIIENVVVAPPVIEQQQQPAPSTDVNNNVVASEPIAKPVEIPVEQSRPVEIAAPVVQAPPPALVVIFNLCH